MHVCSVEIADTRTRGREMVDRQNQLKMLKPRQETDLYVSLEMGIGRPMTNQTAFRAALLKFKLNGFDVRRKFTGSFWAAQS